MTMSEMRPTRARRSSISASPLTREQRIWRIGIVRPWSGAKRLIQLRPNNQRAPVFVRYEVGLLRDSRRPQESPKFADPSEFVGITSPNQRAGGFNPERR